MSLFSFFSKDRELLSKITLTFVSRGFSAFGTLFLNLVLGRVLGVAGVGLFMLAFTGLTGLSVISRFGMDVAILRFAGIAYGEKDGITFRSLRRQTFWLATGISFTLAGGLYFGRGWLACQVFNKPELAGVFAVMAFVLPFYTHILIQTSFLKALGRPILAPFFEPGSVAFIASVIILLANVVKDGNSPILAAWSLFCATAACFVVGQLVLLWSERSAFVGESGKSRTCLLLSSILPNYAVMSLVMFMIQWGGMLILGVFVSAEQVGLFSVAHRSAFVINFILNVFNSIIAPQFAYLYKNDQAEKLEGLAIRSTLYMTLLAVPILLFFVFFPEFILGLFGPEFVAASPYLICLAVAQFVNVSTGSVGFLLTMTGAEHLMRNIVICAGLSSLILNITLCPILGVWGAVIATATSLVMQNLLAAWLVRRTLGIVTIPGLQVFRE